jgi:hypothetical protein
MLGFALAGLGHALTLRSFIGDTWTFSSAADRGLTSAKKSAQVRPLSCR